MSAKWSRSTSQYLPDVGQSIHDQAVLSVLVVIQLQHGAAVLVQEEAFGALVSWVKWIHDNGLRAFDLTAAERTTLAIRFLQHMWERVRIKKKKGGGMSGQKHTALAQI